MNVNIRIADVIQQRGGWVEHLFLLNFAIKQLQNNFVIKKVLTVRLNFSLGQVNRGHVQHFRKKLVATVIKSQNNAEIKLMHFFGPPCISCRTEKPACSNYVSGRDF